MIELFLLYKKKKMATKRDKGKKVQHYNRERATAYPLYIM